MGGDLRGKSNDASIRSAIDAVLVVAALAFQAFVFSTTPAYAIEEQVYPVCVDFGAQTSPDVSATRIAWHSEMEVWGEYQVWDELFDQGTGQSDYFDGAGYDTDPFKESPFLYGDNYISMQNDGLHVVDLITSEESVTGPPVGAYGPPQLSEDGIVAWMPALGEYATYDVGTQTYGKVTSASIPKLPGETRSFSPIMPIAAGDRLAFGGHFVSGIFTGPVMVWDLESQTRQDYGNSDFYSALSQAMSPNYLVWIDRRDDHVHAVRFSTGEETVIEASHPWSDDDTGIDISGDRIVWADARNGNLDVYEYDLVTHEERQITSNPREQRSPAIYGDRIAWVDTRNGEDDIYANFPVDRPYVDYAPPVTTAKVEGDGTEKVIVTLSAVDSSTVDSTWYALDDGEWVEGTTIVVEKPGRHTLYFSSEDEHGNTEADKSVSFAVVGPTSIEASVSASSVSADTTITVGTVVRGWKSLPRVNALVRFESRAEGSDEWKVFASARTDANGAASCPFVVTSTCDVRVVYPGIADYSAPASTAPHKVGVPQPSVLGLVCSHYSPAYRTAATLTGTLLSKVGFRPIAGRAVRLQCFRGGVWQDAGVMRSDSNGRVSFAVLDPDKGQYRLDFGGDLYAWQPTTSRTVTITPGILLTTPVAPKTMKVNKYYTVYGSLKPAHPSGRVRLYKEKRVKVRGKWTWKKYSYVNAKVKAVSSATSRYSVKMRLTSKGTWRIRAYMAADGTHLAGTSAKYDTISVK